MLKESYPQEHYIELTGLSPFLVGRITIMQQGMGHFNVDIDIIQNESGKIYNHVRSLYNESDARDALDTAIQYLKDFLDSKKH